MALNMKDAAATPAKAPDAPATTAVPAKPVEQDTLLLELTMYTNYTWQKKTYKKGAIYRFLRTEAMKLLQEQDNDRPIWRIYRKPVKKAVERGPVDSTNVRVESIPEDLDDGVTEPTKRIDVGTDAEIQDIVDAAAEDDGSDGGEDPGDVTI